MAEAGGGSARGGPRARTLAMAGGGGGTCTGGSVVWAVGADRPPDPQHDGGPMGGGEGLPTRCGGPTVPAEGPSTVGAGERAEGQGVGVV